MFKSIIALPIQVATRTWHRDVRGDLTEVMKKDDTVLYQDDLGQVFITTIQPGVIKAWHYRKKQADRLFVVHGKVRFGALTIAPSGECKICLDYIISSDSSRVLMIPPTVYYGFANIGDDEAHITNVPTLVYNPEDPDEFMEPFDKFTEFDWKRESK